MHEEFIGTMPVQDRHRFDVERLAQYMRAHVEGFAGPLEVAQFKLTYSAMSGWTD